MNLSDKRCGSLLIAEGDQLLGIFTDGDLRRALQDRGSDALQQTLSALMSSGPRSVPSDLLAWKAMEQMEEGSPVTVLPGVDDGRLVGLIRMHDILQSGL